MMSIKYGIVFLSWRSPLSLALSLKALQPLYDHKDVIDRVIFFQEINEEDYALSDEYGFRAIGNDKNVGIMEGMLRAVEGVNADVVLYLECDCLFMADVGYAKQALKQAAVSLIKNELDVMRLRHLRHPGADYTPWKYLRYWPDRGGSDSWITRLRRIFRPGKARRLIGESCLVHDHPDQLFPNEIRNVNNSYFSMSSRVINWTNQSIMFRKKWFLETIIPYAQAHPSSRRVNGFSDLEKELNGRWWRKQQFRVGWANPGLFTHQRMDRPRKDEKNIHYEKDLDEVLAS